MVTVYNLSTGEVQTYSHDDVKRAVAAAWLIEHGRAGDVTRPDAPRIAGVERGKYGWHAGDWSGFLRMRAI
jgi:hypothetical protein